MIRFVVDAENIYGLMLKMVYLFFFFDKVNGLFVDVENYYGLMIRFVV